MSATIDCNLLLSIVQEVMWSKTSHQLFGEFRFICGRFGCSKGSNPNTTCLHCHGVEIRILNRARSVFLSNPDFEIIFPSEK